jgi:hypothetical protein
MIEKKIVKLISCPNCGNIVKTSGLPKKRYIIVCPDCNSKGYYQFPEIKKKTVNEKIKLFFSIYFPYIIITVLIVLFLIFEVEDSISYLIFFTLIPVFIYYDYDGRIFIYFSILMFFIASLTIIFYKNESYANYLAVYVFWMLLVGTLCLLIDYLISQLKQKYHKFSG